MLNRKIHAVVRLLKIEPHDGVLYKSGKRWMDKAGNVRQAKRKVKTAEFINLEAHLDGKNLHNAGLQISDPISDTAIICKENRKWFLLHDETEYKIICWIDLPGHSGKSPITRRKEGNLVYFLSENTDE